MDPTSFDLLVTLLKIIYFTYALIPIIVILYGIRSIITNSSRIYGDDDSNYSFSSKLTVINSIINKSVTPFIYHRTIPHDSRSVKGDTAKLTGIVYIILGLLLLIPLYLGKGILNY